MDKQNVWNLTLENFTLYRSVQCFDTLPQKSALWVRKLISRRELRKLIDVQTRLWPTPQTRWSPVTWDRRSMVECILVTSSITVHSTGIAKIWPTESVTTRLDMHYRLAWAHSVSFTKHKNCHSNIYCIVHSCILCIQVYKLFVSS